MDTDEQGFTNNDNQKLPHLSFSRFPPFEDSRAPLQLSWSRGKQSGRSVSSGVYKGRSLLHEATASATVPVLPVCRMVEMWQASSSQVFGVLADDSKALIMSACLSISSTCATFKLKILLKSCIVWA
jgi:hypothetical protein